jgi:hypothetical protein
VDNAESLHTLYSGTTPFPSLVAIGLDLDHAGSDLGVLIPIILKGLVARQLGLGHRGWKLDCLVSSLGRSIAVVMVLSLVVFMVRMGGGGSWCWWHLDIGGT